MLFLVTLDESYPKYVRLILLQIESMYTVTPRPEQRNADFLKKKDIDFTSCCWVALCASHGSSKSTAFKTGRNVYSCINIYAHSCSKPLSILKTTFSNN